MKIVTKAMVCPDCDRLAEWVLIGSLVVPRCPECDGTKKLVTIKTWEEMNGETFE